MGWQSKAIAFQKCTYATCTSDKPYYQKKMIMIEKKPLIIIRVSTNVLTRRNLDCHT